MCPDKRRGGLAVDGGTPVRSAPMPPRRLFGREEKRAVDALLNEAIETGGVFGYDGPQEQAFEAEFAEYMGGGYADGVNSGSSALFAALGALELEPGSEVIVPPITDPGGVMPVAMLNCVPVFADADRRSYNTGPDQVAEALTGDTRAIIIAHIGGEPVEMEPIMELARERGLPVVEDCAQAFGARSRGRLVGTFGDLAAFSTMSGKHMATGAQGGIVFTREEELHWKAKRFADRGKPLNLPEAGSNVVVGLNLNSNELSAAIGRAQLRKLPGIVERRHRAGEGVKEGLRELAALSVGWQPPNTECSYWFLRIRLEPERLSVDKERFVEALVAEGIPAGASYRHIQAESTWWQERDRHWCPWLCRDRGEKAPVLPNAIACTDCHFNMSFHEGYGDDEVRDIVEALAKLERAYLK